MSEHGHKTRGSTSGGAAVATDTVTVHNRKTLTPAEQAALSAGNPAWLRVHRGQTGGPSPWSNPFPVGGHTSRAEAIRLHAELVRSLWVHEAGFRRAVRDLARRPGPLHLVCCCAPAPCHGETLAAGVRRLRADPSWPDDKPPFPVPEPEHVSGLATRRNNRPAWA